MAKANNVLYLNVHPGSHVQEMKLAGLRRFAEVKRWTVLDVPALRSHPSAVPALLCRHSPVGVIVECSVGRPDFPPRLFGKTPVVYIDCPDSFYGTRIARVVDDGVATARAAFRELASMRPDAFAAVGYRDPQPWSDLRVREFCRLACEDGYPCLMFRPADLTTERRIGLLTKWVAALPRGTAIFAVNDETAAEVLQACHSCGRKVRSDLTIVGVDNVEALCERTEPPLTSVQLDAERAGYRAAQLLDRLLSGGSRARCEVYGPQLTVRRESTRGSCRCGPRIQAAVERIRREACDGLTAEDVAKSFPGSRRLFEMRFREAMGHSVLDEIRNVRLEKAFALLAESRTAISAIAGLCGYGTERALRKAFSLQTGLSMHEWRRQNVPSA